MTVLRLSPTTGALTLALLLTTWLPAPLSAAVEGDARYECLLEPMIVTDVGSPVQGVIETLTADRSEFVRRGQPIAQLKSDIERATLEQAQARARMESEIRARTADLKLAEHSMDRMDNLYAQKMISDQQRDEAFAQLQVASAALNQAQENYRLLQHELNRAEEMLAQRTIRSPVDGVVVAHSAFPGEFVYENPVMTIAQLDPLRVEVILPARLFGQFQPGDVAAVYPEIGGAEPLIAEVDVVDRLLDTRSGTFGVRLKLPNADFAIPGGQKCQLQFQTNREIAKR